MKLQELILQFRRETDDLKDPVSWESGEIVAYLNEAEQEACMRARLLYDDYTTAVTDTAVSAGKNRYVRDPRLFEITAAWLHDAADTRRSPLKVLTRDLLDKTRYNWRIERGIPEFLVVDDTALTLSHVFHEDYVLRLEGWRLPMEDLALDKPLASPEIAAQHHRFLVHWAKYRAYQKPDTETLNPGAAQASLDAFEGYFGYRTFANQGLDLSAGPQRNRCY